MYLKDRINIKRYLFASVFNGLVITGISADSFEENIYLLLVLIGSVLNQLLLVYSVNSLFIKNQRVNNFKILCFMVLKSVILGAVFYIAVQKIPHKLLNSVLIYIFQLIILSLSIKRIKN